MTKLTNIVIIIVVIDKNLWTFVS